MGMIRTMVASPSKMIMTMFLTLLMMMYTLLQASVHADYASSKLQIHVSSLAATDVTAMI